MALTKVTKQISDATSTAFAMLWAKMASPPSAAADADTVMPAHALIDTSEALVNPATSDNQTTLNTTMGATGDAAVSAGATGSISAKLRSISRDLVANIVLAAGSAIIGKVGIDQTTSGTTNLVAIISGQNGVSGGAGAVAATTPRITLASDDPAVTTLGATGDAAVTAGATGSISAKLRSISRDIVSNIVLAAGTAAIGTVGTTLSTTKALTNANVSFSTSGENTLVSGTGGQTIRVHRMELVAASAVTLTVKDAAGGTTLATIPLSAGGSWSLGFNGGEPHFVTASSGAFVISLSGAVQISGYIQYVKS